MADAWFLIIVISIFTIALIFIYKKYRLATWFCLSVIIGAVLLNKVLKNFFDRPRPFNVYEIDNLVHASSYSFPSGHAMGSIISYLLLAYIINKVIKNNILKYILIVISILLSITICFTRVYLGVHYPTDVIAGFSLGLAWALLCILVYRNFVRK